MIKKQFWNSNLGILILSAIFLTLIPFLYTNTQNSISQKRLESKQRIKISSEISHRLNTIKLITVDKIRPYQIKDIRLATFGVKEELRPEYFNFNPIFDDFRNTSLLSLVYQLENITYSEKKKKSNLILKEGIKNIKPFLDKLVLNPVYRKKIILSESKWTFEYSFPDSLKKKVNELIIMSIDDWQARWDLEKK